MKRYVLILFLLLIGIYLVKGQSNLNEFNGLSIKDRLIYGGGLGLSVGTATNIDISPQVMFRHTNRLNEGVGFIYRYYAKSGISTSIYGGKAFANFMVTEQFFPHVEFEALNLESKFFDPLGVYSSDRYWYQSFLVGGGYYMAMSARSGMYMLVLYNLNDSSNSPYPSPWVFRMGFTF